MTVTRLVDQDRPALSFTVDGAEIVGKQGDTLLTAMLAGGLTHVRRVSPCFPTISAIPC